MTPVPAVTKAPPVNYVIEAGIYCDDLDAAAHFYGEILGLKEFLRTPGRNVFYAIGRTVLLVFAPAETAKAEDLPAHGARGPGHFAFQIDPDQYDPWIAHLHANGVTIEHEHHWPDGKSRSIYFRDPAGNLVELITRPAWEHHFSS